MSAILAVILNWNDIAMTLKAIDSLITQDKSWLDILIVDNDSDEDPQPVLKKKYPDIYFIRNSQNLGVAGGRNVGIHYALDHGYKYVLLFDNDAVAAKDMISELIKAANHKSDSGIFGPKILRMDSPGIIWRAGCRSWKWAYLHSGSVIIQKIFGLLHKTPPGILAAFPGQDEVDQGQHDKEMDIAFQIGCAQFIRTDVFRDIGLLDEEFNPYGWEDIDFCARVTKKGWRIRYVPSARCWHRIGGSYRDDYLRTFNNSRNMILFARKRLSPLYFWLIMLPDYFFLTIPLMLLQFKMKKLERCRQGFIDAILWHIKDIRKRGLSLRLTDMG